MNKYDLIFWYTGSSIWAIIGIAAAVGLLILLSIGIFSLVSRVTAWLGAKWLLHHGIDDKEKARIQAMHRSIRPYSDLSDQQWMDFLRYVNKAHTDRQTEFASPDSKLGVHREMRDLLCTTLYRMDTDQYSKSAERLRELLQLLSVTPVMQQDFVERLQELGMDEDPADVLLDRMLWLAKQDRHFIHVNVASEVNRSGDTESPLLHTISYLRWEMDKT